MLMNVWFADRGERGDRSMRRIPGGLLRASAPTTTLGFSFIFLPSLSDSLPPLDKSLIVPVEWYYYYIYFVWVARQLPSYKRVASRSAGLITHIWSFTESQGVSDSLRGLNYTKGLNFNKYISSNEFRVVALLATGKVLHTIGSLHAYKTHIDSTHYHH